MPFLSECRLCEWRQCRLCESGVSAVCARVPSVPLFEGGPLSSAVASLVCWVGLSVGLRWASLFVAMGLVYTCV